MNTRAPTDALRNPCAHVAISIAFALLLALASSALRAANCVSNVATGNWNVPATWTGCGGGNGTPINTPGSADNVTIGAGHNITLNGNRRALSLTVIGTLTTGSADVTIVAGTGVIAVTGNILGNGNASSRVIKLSTGDLSGTGTFTNLQNVTITGDTTIAAGSSLTFTGAECQLDLSANADVINNGTLTFSAAPNCATSRTITLANPSTFTNNGTADVGTVTGTAGAVWTNAANSSLTTSGALLATGTLTASAIPNMVNYNSTAAQTVKAANYHNLTISGARTTNSVTLFNGGTIGVAGVFNPAATFSTGNYINTNNTMNFNGTGPQTIPAFNYNNLTSSSTGARTLAGAGIVGVRTTFTPGTNAYTVTGSTMDFNGTVAQTIPAFNYENLTISGARTNTNVTLVSGGTLGVAGAFNPTATFTTGSYVSTNNTVNFNGAVPQTIPAFNYNNLTSSSTGARTLAAAGTIGVRTTFTPGGNTYTIAGSTVNFNGTGVQTVPAFNYDNLSISGAHTTNNVTLVNGTIGVAGNFLATATFTGAGNYVVTGNTVHFNGTGAQNIGAFNYNNLTTSGAHGASSITLANTGTIGIAGIFNPTATFAGGAYVNTGSTVNFNGAGPQSIPAFNYNNLTSSSTGARTLAGAGTVGVRTTFTPGTNAYTITGSTVDFNGTAAQTIAAFSYNNLTVSGARTTNSVTLVSGGTIGVAGVFNPAATFSTGNYINTNNTVNFNGTGPQTIPAFNYNNLTSSSTGARTLAAAGTIGVRTTFTRGGNTYTVAGSTMDFNGTAAQTIPTFNYENLTISGARTTNSVTLISGGTIGVAGAFSPTATFSTGNYINTNNTVNFNGAVPQTIPAFNYNNLTSSSTGARTLASTGTIGVRAIFTPFTNVYTITGSMVNFNGTTAQTVPRFNYNNLTISGARTTTSVTLVNGNIVGVAGTFAPIATFSTGNYIVTNNTVAFNGTTPQTSGGFTYHNLTINNSTGVAMTGDATVRANLTLTSGNINALTNTVIVSPAATVSRASGHVIGNLRKSFATGLAVSRTYEVGDASAYSPAAITFASVGTAGTLTIRATAGLHPDAGSSGVDPTQVPAKQSVNRYWTATNGGIVFTTYSATLNYVSGDLDAGLNLATVGIARGTACDGSVLNCTWSYPTLSGPATATSTQATGLTGFDYFLVGRKVAQFVFAPIGTQTANTPFPIQVTAVDSLGNTVTGFTGTASITSGSHTITSGGGTTPAFVGGVYSGSITVSNSGSGSLTATQTSNATVTGTSNLFTSNPQVSSFNAFETSTAANATTGKIFTKLIGTAFSIDVVAVAGGAQAPGFSDNVKVELLSNTGTVGAGYGADNCPTSNSVLQTIASAAISGGRSTVGFGAVAIAARDVRVRISYPTVAPTVTTCSLDSFAVRPLSFTVSSTNATNSGSSGAPFFKTGANFQLQAVSAASYIGTPSIDGSAVVGSPAAGAIGGVFNSAISGTASGATFTYSEVGNFSFNDNAIHDDTFTTVDQPADCTADFSTIPVGGKYGCRIGSTATAPMAFGRFTPDNFEVTYNSPGLAAACGTFSYVGQTFNYMTPPVMTVTARNGLALGNATTVNYAGTYVKLTAGGLTPGTQAGRYSRFDALGGGNTPAIDYGLLPPTATDPAVSSFINGVGTLTFSGGGGLGFVRSNTAPNAPFDADLALAINVVDSDSVAFAGNPASFGAATAGNGMTISGGKAMRFGRLRILNATGVASLALNVPIRTEYWTGTGFALNTADSCTTLARANIALGAYAKSLNACETRVTTDPVTFASGVGTLRLSAPNAGNEGSVTVSPQLGAAAAGNYCITSPGAESAATPATRSYLQGPWIGTTYDANPAGRASFGTYGAQPRNFIFFREN